jgi:hypothetical protein
LCETGHRERMRAMRRSLLIAVALAAALVLAAPAQAET